MKRSHYETLGVAPDADVTAVKRAYRAKARKHHPDIGGDTASFQAIQRAYSILKDPKKRADYDQFGDASESMDAGSRAEQDLIALIVRAAVELDSKHVNILDRIREGLRNQRREVESKIQKTKAEAEKFRDAASRLKRKGGGDTVFVQALLIQAGGCEQRIKTIRKYVLYARGTA